MGLLRNLIAMNSGGEVHGSGLLTNAMRGEANRKRTMQGKTPYEEERAQAPTFFAQQPVQQPQPAGAMPSDEDEMQRIATLKALQNMQRMG